MRRRYQRGSVTKSTDGRYWLGKYRDPDKKHKTKSLGKIGKMTKSEAQEQLDKILRPVNAVIENVGPTMNVFLDTVYFPLLVRKWKDSTYETNRYRIRKEIGGVFGDRLLATLTRGDLQSLLDMNVKLSHSTVLHLRWDLKQIFDLALAEGLVTKNPAGEGALYVPQGCPKPVRDTMTFEEVRRGYSLELRERLVFKLATVGGMRPGEIFGLRRGSVFAKVIDIHERLYRGKMNTPKSQKSERKVPPAPTLLEDIDCWLLQCPDRGPDSWLFPSERLTTPLSKDNFMSRWMRPALKNIGLGRVNFQIMRRTHACLMKALKEDPKVVADLMGHNVNVHLNVYTQSSMEARQQAVNNLEFAIIN